MKEVTYGWYPSQQDIYRPKGRPSSYHLECLYKYGDSLYYQGQVSPPEPELFVRGHTSTPSKTPSEIRRQRAKSVNVPKFKPVPKLQIPNVPQCWATQKTDRGVSETPWGLIDQGTTPQIKASECSWPLPKKTQKEQQQEQKQLQQQEERRRQQLLQIKQHLQQKYGKDSPETQYAWGMKAASHDVSPRSVASTASGLAWPVAMKPVPKRPQTASGVQLSERQTPIERQQLTCKLSRPLSSPAKPRTPCAAPGPPSVTRPASSKKPSRVQSATLRREKTPLPSRPVTACSTRQQPPTDEPPVPPQTVPECPEAPVPFVYDVNDNSVRLEEEEELLRKYPIEEEDEEEYEDIVDKYGWRAEVHGDPYGLKKTTKRLSYVSPCKEPEVPPDPPKVHMETNEPFFHNTIPRRPATFAVHKEWMSEILLAKRLELQKREGGVKYDYKKFAFVY